MTQATDNQAPAGAEGEAKEIASPRIIEPKGRSKTIPLDWPLDYDGKTFDKVTIRRVSGKEVEEFLAAVSAKEEGDPSLMLPTIECPRAVYDAMDDDDRLKVDEVAFDFLPRRLKDMAGGSTPSATSEKSSDE